MQGKMLTDFYEDGKIRTLSIWESDHGIIRGWREDGQRDFEVEIKDGITTRRMLWDERGQLKLASATA